MVTIWPLWSFQCSATEANPRKGFPRRGFPRKDFPKKRFPSEEFPLGKGFPSDRFPLARVSPRKPPPPPKKEKRKEKKKQKNPPQQNTGETRRNSHSLPIGGTPLQISGFGKKKQNLFLGGQQLSRNDPYSRFSKQQGPAELEMGVPGPGDPVFAKRQD